MTEKNSANVERGMQKIIAVIQGAQTAVRGLAQPNCFSGDCGGSPGLRFEHQRTGA